MNALRPEKTWWTVSELAEAALPDLPATRQNVDAYAKRSGWREHPELSRKRSGRGGGWEYNWKLLPMRARRRLLKQASATASSAVASPAQSEAELHAYYEGLPDKVKRKTQDRLKAVRAVVALEKTGLTRFLSSEEVARSEGVSVRTIWNWLGLVDGIDQADWLYHLAPRNRAAQRSGPRAECSREFFDRLKSLYLCLEGTTFAASYRDAVKIANARGWTVLPERTARRRLNETVPRVVQVYAREGEAGLAKCFPPLQRDRSQMHAMEGVNADCHKFDVFVRWQDGKIERCQIVAFQDLYSGKVLSWRIDHTPNEVAVMSAFGEMIETYGIPEHCTFDNGREFAAKWLTGGAKTRYRGKIRDDDPLGVLPLLGVEIHWAQPGHGQAKPIERTFRDFASDIAKDVRFEGAYVGNRPDAKPENYGNAAVPIEYFIKVVDERIKEHNARLGRRSHTVLGSSFDETFARSYEASPIRRASDEQRRLWLMGQKALTMQQGSGRIHLFGNYYWSDWMAELAGKKIVARFDIEDLHAGAYIYELTGEFLGFAPCKLATGFYDLSSAKENARHKAAYRRVQKKLLEKERVITRKQIAAEMDGLGTVDPELPENKIVQMPKGDARPAAARAVRPAYEDRQTPEEQAQVLEFQARVEAEQAQQKQAAQDDETPRQRFHRALEIERKSDAGERVGEREMRWLLSYQTSAEYSAEKMLHDDFADAMFVE